MRKREVVVLRLSVDQNRVALAERAALRILPREAHGIALEKYGAERQHFGEAVIDGTLAMAHFRALFEKLRDFRVDVKPLGHANKAVGDFREFFLQETGIDLIFRFVAAMLIGGPVFWQFAQVRYFSQRAGLGLLLFVFLADCLSRQGRVDAGVLGVNLPERSMILDALVKEGLRDGRIVDLAVAVAAIADEVNDDVAAEGGAIFRGKLSDAHDGVWVFGVDVEDRHGLAFGDIGSEAGRVLLRGLRGKADQVIHDDVNGAADGVSLQVREIQRFRPDALACERRIAVHHDGDDFIHRFWRTVGVGAAQTVASLLRAHPAHGDWIDSFQMARIRNKMDADLFACARDVGARRAYVVFHVARTEDAAGIDVFKTGHHFMWRLACRVDHHVQAAAVTHGHDGFERAMLARGVQNGIEQRNQRGNAFQGKSFGAQVARLQNLFEKIGANQTLEDFVLIDLACRRF